MLPNFHHISLYDFYSVTIHTAGTPEYIKKLAVYLIEQKITTLDVLTIKKIKNQNKRKLICLVNTESDIFSTIPMSDDKYNKIKNEAGLIKRKFQLQEFNLIFSHKNKNNGAYHTHWTVIQ